MSDVIFVAKQVTRRLDIGDTKELDRAEWRKPRHLRLSPTSHYIRDKLLLKLS